MRSMQCSVFSGKEKNNDERIFCESQMEDGMKRTAKVVSERVFKKG